jgi:hypothetical protein
MLAGCGLVCQLQGTPRTVFGIGAIGGVEGIAPLSEHAVPVLALADVVLLFARDRTGLTADTTFLIDY